MARSLSNPDFLTNPLNTAVRRAASPLAKRAVAIVLERVRAGVAVVAVPDLLVDILGAMRRAAATVVRDVCIMLAGRLGGGRVAVVGGHCHDVGDKSRSK